MNEVSLIVMAKRPELGKVKTRFAKTEGDEAALELYRRLLQELSKLIINWPGSVHVWWSGEASDGSTDASRLAAHEHFEQPEGDLGYRMQLAFNHGLSRPDVSACLMIGADCPDLSKDHLVEAALLLNSVDVVFGPALDGGYYLVGMKQLHESLLTNMPWSTPEVLQLSIKRLENAESSYALLSQTLTDIDEIADLKASAWGSHRSLS